MQAQPACSGGYGDPLGKVLARGPSPEAASRAHASHGASLGAGEESQRSALGRGVTPEVKGPTRGVGAEPFDARATPFLVGGVGALGGVAVAVGEDPLAQRQHDGDRQVGGAVVDAGARVRARAGGARLVEGELHARRGGVGEGVDGGLGVAGALVEFVLEFAGDHSLHVAQALERDVLIVLQRALDLARQDRQRFVDGAGRAGRRVRSGASRAWPPRGPSLGAGAVAPRSSSVALRSRAKISLTTSVPDASSSSDRRRGRDVARRGAGAGLARRLGLRWLASAMSGASGCSCGFGDVTKRRAREQFLLGGLGARRAQAQRLEGRGARRLVGAVDVVQHGVDLLAHARHEGVQRVARGAQLVDLDVQRLALDGQVVETALRASLACSTMARPCSRPRSTRASPLTLAESISRSAARRASWSIWSARVSASVMKSVGALLGLDEVVGGRAAGSRRRPGRCVPGPRR